MIDIYLVLSFIVCVIAIILDTYNVNAYILAVLAIISIVLLIISVYKFEKKRKHKEV